MCVCVCVCVCVNRPGATRFQGGFVKFGESVTPTATSAKLCFRASLRTMGEGGSIILVVYSKKIKQTQIWNTVYNIMYKFPNLWYAFESGCVNEDPS